MGDMADREWDGSKEGRRPMAKLDIALYLAILLVVGATLLGVLHAVKQPAAPQAAQAPRKLEWSR